MSATYQDTIPSGTIDTAPVRSVSISGQAYYTLWSGRIRIIGFDKDEINAIKRDDGIVLGGELFIVRDVINKVENANEVAYIRVKESATVSSSHSNVSVKWAKGRRQVDYPKGNWCLVSDNYSINGEASTSPLNFDEKQSIVLIDAVTDVLISSGHAAEAGGGGGGGGIETIVEGQGISVDDSDPLNPIVSVLPTPATVVPITEDYEFSVSDINKLLYVAAPDVTLTMPDPFPFGLLDKVYVFPNVNTKMQVVNSAPAIELPDVSTGSNPFLTCFSIGTLLTPDFGIISVGARTLEYSKYLSENVTRSIEVNSDDQPISNGVPYGLIDVEVPLGDAVGGSVTVTITVTDGTDVQVITDNITYTAINVGGTITGDVDVAVSSNTLSSGTLSTSYSISQNGSNATLQITATSSLTPTLIKINSKTINSTNSKM